MEQPDIIHWSDCLCGNCPDPLLRPVFAKPYPRVKYNYAGSVTKIKRGGPRRLRLRPLNKEERSIAEQERIQYWNGQSHN